VSRRFLALGDSYTIGELVAEAQRWPVLLADLLRARGLDVGAPEIVAQTGWTTDELAAAIAAARLRGPYDLVSLLIGVNDQYRGRDLREYAAGFRELLARAVDFAGGSAGRVLVLSIPDWSVTPFADGDARGKAAIAQALDAFNAEARRQARAAGAYWVDITPTSRRAGGDPSLLTQDALHPSGFMYAEWAELAFPAARAALASTGPR
jgi:lysophospholipase L1-like esterase